MNDDTPSPRSDAGTTSSEDVATVTATSGTSWMIAAGNAVLGHVTQNGDVFTAYDAQELRVGDYPTRDDAVAVITTGTR